MLFLSSSLCSLLASVCLKEASVLCGLSEAVVLLVACLYIYYIAFYSLQRKKIQYFCINVDCNFSIISDGFD